VRHKTKESLLVVCLFSFLLIVIGGGLHLNPTGAFLAALTGTPLIIHLFTVWSRSLSGISPPLRRVAAVRGNDTRILESRDVIRQ
jgi:hypothetical protein